MKRLFFLLIVLTIGKAAQAQTCSGTPSAGTLSASSTISCGSGTLTLSLSGETADSGIGYQWQCSSDTSTWSNLYTGTVASYSFTPTGAYYYRCQVSCAASSDTATSNVVKVSYTTSCPCTPTYEYSYYMEDAMTYFYLAGYSGTSISDYGASTGSSYEDRTSAVSAVSLQDGGSYSGYIYTYTYYYFDNQIWIDFNDNGAFASSEAVTSVFGGYSSSFSYSMSIPITASTGDHRMRVRNAYSYVATLSSAMSPCNTFDASTGSFIYYYYGTTWDYLANIVPLPGCHGSPSGGSASASPLLSCGTGTLTLALSGATAGPGIDYQWQYSSDSATWSNISGGSASPYSFMPSGAYYYRCRVSCSSSSDTAYSHQVLVNYTSSCPCTASYESGFDSYYAMTYFYLSGYGSASISDGGDSVASGYEDRTSAVSPVSLQEGGIYSGYLYTYYSYYYEHQIWIDFNDDGSFSSSEAVTTVFGIGSYTSYFSYTMSIPTAATTGPHRMRVRTACTEITSGSTAMDPCYSSDTSSGSVVHYFYGSTWDYVANIIAGAHTTGITSAQTSRITIYPNPARNQIYITSTSAFRQVLISNSLGQTIKTMENDNNTTAIDIATLPPGTYFVTLTGTDGVKTAQFVKE
jgi:Secretion system C-terminal sorting domain/GEVED domain